MPFNISEIPAPATDGTYAAGTAIVLRSRVTGDTNPEFAISANGNLAWGPGSAPADINLLRFGVSTAQFDGALVIGSNPITLSNGGLALQFLRDTGGSVGVNISGTSVVSFGPGLLVAVQNGAALRMSNGAYAGGSNVGSNFSSGTGAPVNASGANGDYYFRLDASASVTAIYQRRVGVWVDLFSTIASPVTVAGNVDVTTVGSGLKVAEGANAKQGLSAAMVAGAVTVANTSVTATSRIVVTRQDGGTNPGAAYVSARVAGTSFTVTSTNAADTGQIAYEIFEVG